MLKIAASRRLSISTILLTLIKLPKTIRLYWWSIKWQIGKKRHKYNLDACFHSMASIFALYGRQSKYHKFLDIMISHRRGLWTKTQPMKTCCSAYSWPKKAVHGAVGKYYGQTNCRQNDRLTDTHNSYTYELHPLSYRHGSHENVWGKGMLVCTILEWAHNIYMHMTMSTFTLLLCSKGSFCSE